MEGKSEKHINYGEMCRARHLRDTPVCSVGLNQYFDLMDDGDAEKWYAFYYGNSEENKEMRMKSIRDFYGD